MPLFQSLVRGAARRAALTVVIGWSMGLGSVLLWQALSPAMLGRVTTPELLVLLGLQILPAVAVFIWLVDRRQAMAEAPLARPAAADEPVRAVLHTPEQPRLVRGIPHRVTAQENAAA